MTKKKAEEPKPRKIVPLYCSAVDDCKALATHMVIARSHAVNVPVRTQSCPEHTKTPAGAYDAFPLAELRAMEQTFNYLPFVRAELSALLYMLASELDSPDNVHLLTPRTKKFLTIWEQNHLQEAHDFCHHPSNPLRYYGHPDLQHRFLANDLIDNEIERRKQR